MSYGGGNPCNPGSFGPTGPDEPEYDENRGYEFNDTSNRSKPEEKDASWIFVLIILVLPIIIWLIGGVVAIIRYLINRT